MTKVLQQLKQLGFRFLAASSLRHSSRPFSCADQLYYRGGCTWEANLEQPPFSFPPALAWTEDRKYGASSRHPMAEWERRQPPRRGADAGDKWVGLWSFAAVPS